MNIYLQNNFMNLQMEEVDITMEEILEVDIMVVEILEVEIWEVDLVVVEIVVDAVEEAFEVKIVGIAEGR